MISLARAAERSEQSGVEYRIADVEELVLDDQFDVVVAAFLLNVDYRKYGFERLVAPDLRNGSQYVFRNHKGDTSFDITVHHLDLATHEQAFVSAGLTNVHWVRPEVSRQGRMSFDAGYWQTFLSAPPIILIEATREREADDELRPV